jgi:hypothetical protein
MLGMLVICVATMLEVRKALQINEDLQEQT